MIVLPWFVRLALDCTVALTPIAIFHYHPSTVFEYFQNNRRLIRRKGTFNCMLRHRPVFESGSFIGR